MKKNAPKTSNRAAWWILILAVLGLAMALIFVMVVRREKPRSGSRASASTKSGASTGGVRGPGSGRGASNRLAPPASRREALSRRVNRRRLAELLGRTSKGTRPETPGHGPGSGTPGSRGDPPLDEEPPTVFPLNAKGIRGAIRARIEEIKECYDGWLATDDTLGGKLVLAFTIEKDPDGELARISSAEIQGSTLQHPGLERCVLVMAESLSFEAPEDGRITVKYPFRFAPGPKKNDQN